MWLFGYGSLMWDGWERSYGCVQRLPAMAPGFARIFNKRSLERWGTYERPGLTLNLTAHALGHDGACQGTAFAFPKDRAAEIEAYLSARETCMATDISIVLPDQTIVARTYIYDGPRLIEEGLSLDERAALILAAKGCAGSSYDYLSGVRAHLAELGVLDPAVEELWQAVCVRDGAAENSAADD